MRVVIDSVACTGHGRCYSLVPELFGDDEFGNGMVIVDGDLTDSKIAMARRAVAACPERAISILIAGPALH